MSIYVGSWLGSQWLAPMRKCEWVVYAKPPLAGPAATLAYLSCYSSQRFADSEFDWKSEAGTGRQLQITAANTPKQCHVKACDTVFQNT